jgi:hypothetical protein
VLGVELVKRDIEKLWTLELRFFEEVPRYGPVAERPLDDLTHLPGTEPILQDEPGQVITVPDEIPALTVRTIDETLPFPHAERPSARGAGNMRNTEPHGAITT